MSTYIHLVCLDHDPWITHPDEIEQHIGGTYSAKIAAFIADRERLATIDLWDELQRAEDYFERHASWYFHSHPKCRTGVRDEYGRWHSFPGAYLPPTDNIPPGAVLVAGGLWKCPDEVQP